MTLLPIVNFKAEDTVQCTGQGTQFIDESEGCPVTWLWSFEPGNVTYLDGTDQNSQNPLVAFNEGGAYSVSLTVTNSAGESSMTKNDYISAGGQTLPFSERFQGASFNEMGWGVENPDAKTTWELTTVNGEDQLSWMNFFNYTDFEERDYLTSPLMNFSGMETVLLYFEYAYAQRYFQKDSLIVNISADCGESWTRVYANGPNGEGVFATSEPTADFFEPQEYTDWCGNGYGAGCPVIDLSAWAGQPNIRIQFETYNKYGNNLYLNNVEAGSTVGLFDNDNKGNDFSIYPNPTNRAFKVMLPEKGNFSSLQVVSPIGSVVYEFSLSGKTGLIEINADGRLSPGIWLLRINGEGQPVTRKVVVN